MHRNKPKKRNKAQRKTGTIRYDGLKKRHDKKDKIPSWAADVRFELGAARPEQFPEETEPEIAFAGRSNVGKSSLLNRLFNRRKMVRVSRTPGCTREVNFFRVGEVWRFVDLPGYGFARVNLSRRQAWEEVMQAYLGSRGVLRLVVVLIDIRRGVTDLDQEMLAFLAHHGLPALVVCTKMDAERGNARRATLDRIRRELPELAPTLVGPPLAVSARTGEGMGPLWHRLSGLLNVETSSESVTGSDPIQEEEPSESVTGSDPIQEEEPS
ncbi:MAG: YihA family ribosome biogenesis GTP-binding protein [Magnetococcales bacterium]|nr:YihA family ribosome biogenesis GTP-binding protein [Magnetococcales bacterium]